MEQPETGALLIGEEIAGYRIEAALGTDGMARVYRATAPDGSKAVLKLVYKDERQKCDKERRGAQVQKEVQGRCARLCPMVFNDGVVDGQWFVVALEYIEGQDLL